MQRDLKVLMSKIIISRDEKIVQIFDRKPQEIFVQGKSYMKVRLDKLPPLKIYVRYQQNSVYKENVTIYLSFKEKEPNANNHAVKYVQPSLMTIENF